MDKGGLSDSKYTRITVGLLVGLFVVSPNIANIFFDYRRWEMCCDLKAEVFVWAVRIAVICSLCVLLMMYNLQRIAKGALWRRLLANAAFALPAWGVFVAISVACGVHSDCFTTTLLFQFLIASVLVTVIGFTHQLKTERQRQEDEIIRLKSGDSPKPLPNSISEGATPKRLMVARADRLIPVEAADIACIYSTAGNTSIIMLDGRTLALNRTLDSIGRTLGSPQLLYRANRQFIVNRRAIRELTVGLDSRIELHLSVPTPEKVFVSKNRAANFREWFA